MFQITSGTQSFRLSQTSMSVSLEKKSQHIFSISLTKSYDEENCLFWSSKCKLYLHVPSWCQQLMLILCFYLVTARIFLKILHVLSCASWLLSLLWMVSIDQKLSNVSLVFKNYELSNFSITCFHLQLCLSCLLINFWNSKHYNRAAPYALGKRCLRSCHKR